MVSVLVLGWAVGVAAALEPDAAKPPGSDLIAYEAAKASAGRDADAHVALALWCEAHGMPAEKATHLARAVLIDPSHAKARGLLGYVKHEGKWLRPEDVSRAVEDSPESQALFREYQDRRIKARDKADDQYRLAQWCDEHGLAQQATAHFHRVVELDPGREGALRKLGFKKISGHWIKPEMLAAAKAEREAQAKADKLWRSRLAHLKDDLSGRDKAKKAEALEAIAKIDDPRAVPMVWAVFAQGDERWQRLALQIFSQIDSPGSSIALATMAVFHPSVELRSQASQVLLRRDPRSFAGELIGLLEDEIEYKVRAVNGPGSQGELLIKGKGANVDRVYRPMQAPSLAPGDWLSVDDYGMLIANRYLGATTTRSTTYNAAPAADVPASVVAANVAPQLTPYLEKAGLPTQMAPAAPSAGVPWPQAPAAGSYVFGGYKGIGFRYTPSYSYDIYTKTSTTAETMKIPIGWMMMQARESAAVAQQQLSDDVRELDAYNASLREVNDRALTVLRSVSGRDAGAKRESWDKWFVDLQGYAFRSQTQSEPEPPTIVEEVPINYQPIPLGGTVSSSLPTSSVTRSHQVVAANVSSTMPFHSCFAAGTTVRTLRGGRPIESIRPGDQVLTQDTAKGSLQYRPVVTAYHNPPNETYRLDLGKESIVATGIHRFWKAGHGWIMARDVKPGDWLRTIGGAAEVVAVTKDRVQPVFNLQLDGGDDFCVGALGVIAHDNSFVNPVERPFDGVPALADLGSTRKP
ncbi:MAG: polymorphic toxin-type HINT domain-containing protein [Paludisphaera borealis]|uniref:polymorphic toxin-type HINT domain-containing protein n=1 Tax=Paludisphaera borealis TaxID=1387353 RepID=UPI00284AC62D|nr:polymorphic toxin-type HINT domain-containing protein [Paludisphaera borealis]MDR3622744.1 polymorphic toxin-type HINT domain-containing protein [Paludisphaera borealis]